MNASETSLLVGFYYRVEAVLRFNREQIDHCMEMSSRHYDARCRAASAVGGFLYGFQNRIQFADEPTIEVEMDIQQLGTLAKILEAESFASHASITMKMHGMIIEAMNCQNAESSRINS